MHPHVLGEMCVDQDRVEFQRGSPGTRAQMVTRTS
jgi:hypothetical protein